MDVLERARQNWQEHLGLIVSGVVGAVIVLRLLGAAEWDGTTAAAILQHVGSANVIVGAVLSSAENFLAFIALVLGVPLFYQWMRQRKWPGMAWSICALAALLICLVALSMLLILVLLAACLLALAAGRSDRSSEGKVSDIRNLRMAIIAMIGFSLAPFIWNSSMWLPPETVRPDAGPPFTGYVLDQGSDTWVVLRHEPRQVVAVPVTEDQRRTVCEYDYSGWDWLWTRLPEFAGGGPQYPGCP